MVPAASAVLGCGFGFRNDVTDQPESQPEPSSESQTLYRRAAYERRGRVAPIDGILRVSAPREWLVLLLLAVILLAVIAWSFLGRLESGINTACVLRPAGERHAVTASAAGVVVEALAAPGEQVSAGDPLMRLTVPELGLAAELAQARSTALSATDPGSVESAVAAAEAQALQAAEAAAALVLSPATGVMGPLTASTGAAVSAGATVAEVLDVADAAPTALLSVGPGDAASLRPSMAVSVSIVAAGAEDAVRADARFSRAVDAAPSTDSGVISDGLFVSSGVGVAVSAGAGRPGVPDGGVTAEFDDPPAEFAALASQPSSAYRCEARIVTDSQRPIRLLIGG